MRRRLTKIVIGTGVLVAACAATTGCSGAAAAVPGVALYRGCQSCHGPSGEGNSQIGAGSCTIIESKSGELVRSRMDWIRPMAGTSTVDFTFKQAGDKTVVTWAMYGKNTYMGKLVSLFIDCDKMCGPQFEQGLQDLGRAAATTPAAPAPAS